MSDAKIRIHTEDGKTHQAQAPLEIKTEEFISELVEGLGLSTGGDGLGWSLYNKDRGAFLDPGATLGQNGVETGQDLYLKRQQSRRANRFCTSCGAENAASNHFCQRCGKSMDVAAEKVLRVGSSDLKLHVHVPNGTIHSAEVPGSLTVKEFVADLVGTLGYMVRDSKGGTILWKLDDKDSGRSLAEEQTFAQNGVQTGHHLFLRASEQPAPPVNGGRKALPWGIIGAILGGVVLLGAVMAYYAHSPRPGPKPAPTPSLPPPGAITVLVKPQSATLRPSQHTDFEAIVAGDKGQGVRWSAEPEIGSISANGMYRAPAIVSSEQLVKIIATSIADPHASSNAVVTLRPAPTPLPTPVLKISISVVPVSATVLPGHQQEFIAKVGGTNNHAVRWSLVPELGSISADGIYRAPASVSTEETVKITATSVADPHKSSGVMLTLLSNVQVQLDPASTTVAAGKKQKFRANVSGTSNKAVEWSINPALGSINEKGEYKAPSPVGLGQSVKVTATSKADPHKSASAVVTLIPKH